MIDAAVLNDVHQRADCLYTQEQVEQAIATCADRAGQTLVEKQPVVLAVMNGGLTFTDCLLAHWDFPLELDYVHFTRYDGATRGGKNKQIAEPRTELQGRHVVVVDDIFDEGLTLESIIKWAGGKSAASVTSVILADKQHTRKQTDYRPDFVALQVADRYVYGFGMDYRGWLRNKRGIFAASHQDL